MVKLNTILLLIAASVMATAHILALEFFLYWRYEWFDIPMHMLGGAVVALFVFAVYELRLQLPARWRGLIPVIAFVLIISLLWEWYEILIGIPIEGAHEIDTLMDLVSDIVGGLIGFIVGSSVLNLEEKV